MTKRCSDTRHIVAIYLEHDKRLHAAVRRAAASPDPAKAVREMVHDWVMRRKTVALTDDIVTYALNTVEWPNLTEEFLKRADT